MALPASAAACNQTQHQQVIRVSCAGVMCRLSCAHKGKQNAAQPACTAFCMAIHEAPSVSGTVPTHLLRAYWGEPVCLLQRLGRCCVLLQRLQCTCLPVPGLGPAGGQLQQHKGGRACRHHPLICQPVGCGMVDTCECELTYLASIAPVWRQWHTAVPLGPCRASGALRQCCC